MINTFSSNNPLSLNDIPFSPKKVKLYLKNLNQHYHNLQETLKYVSVSKKKIATIIKNFINYTILIYKIQKEEYSKFRIHLLSGTGKKVNKLIKGSRGSRYMSTRRNSNIYSYIIPNNHA